MAVAPIASTQTCPPHHWLIDGDARGHERWSCQRCGVVRDTTVRPLEARRLANVCTWSRDEVVLLDRGLE